MACIATSSFQQSQPRRLAPYINSGASTVKTTNALIFPSLHPLNGIYRNRKEAQTNASPSQTSVTVPEPVKKLRLNSGSDAIALAQNTPISSETSSARCSSRSPVRRVDEDGFRIPQLPRRLMHQNKTQSQAVTTLKRSFEEAQEYYQPTHTTSAKKAPRASNKSRGQNKNQMYQAPIKTEENSLTMKDKLVVNDMALNQTIDPALLNSIYRKLWQEYSTICLLQNVKNMQGHF